MTQPDFRPESSFSYDLGGDFGFGRDSKFTFDLYNTVIHNRFATVQTKFNGIVNGQTIRNINYTFNQANTRDAGIEAGFVHQPRVGLGAAASVDFLRAYAYGTNFAGDPLANVAATGQQAGNYGSIADGAQTVGYPYFKSRGALTYRFRNSSDITFGATSFGANNSFNEAGFTVFDSEIGAAVGHGLRLQLSVSNLFNHDNYRSLGEYAYGIAPLQDPSAVNAGLTTSFNPQSLFFYPPRTLTLQLEHRF